MAIHDDLVNKLLVHMCVKSLNGIIRQSKHLSCSFYSHGINAETSFQNDTLSTRELGTH